MFPPVVDVVWWQQRPDAVVADVRWYLDGRSGHEAYLQGHLPGAVFVDLDRFLAGDPRAGRGRHPLPGPETFAAGMSAAGIGDRTPVVAYDDQGGVIAARLVWMLRVTGHDAALLDGGLQAYAGPLEVGPVTRPAATFTTRSWPRERLAGIEEATDSRNLVLDARSPERYRGEDERVDPRGGHIPGARSLPCRENLDANGKFLAAEKLRARFAAVGVVDGSAVVSYCGSGVTACHNLLALEHCGLGEGRLYPGSWSEYCSSPERSVAI
ncbi:MAG TPA: sulfurtransferase [Acidimicrobiales bacterium]|nr:sulfurtransferase [Acidimicrobiales bacterium]